MKGIRGKRYSCGVLGRGIHEVYWLPVGEKNSLILLILFTIKSLFNLDMLQILLPRISIIERKKIPLTISLHPNIVNLDLSLDDYCGSSHASNRHFSELDMHTLTITGKLGSIESKIEEESKHIMTNENMSMNRRLNQKYNRKSFKEMVG